MSLFPFERAAGSRSTVADVARLHQAVAVVDDASHGLPVVARRRWTTVARHRRGPHLRHVHRATVSARGLGHPPSVVTDR